MEEELKSCPFCGSKAKLVSRLNFNATSNLYMACCYDVDCIGWHDTWEDSKEEAIKVWNTRV